MSSASADGLQGYYRWHAQIYDATRWAFLFGRSQLVRLAAPLGPRRILEVGCGTGTNLVALAKALPQSQIVGLDLSAEMLKKARTKIASYGARVTLLERRYDTPISADERFDLIVFSYCLTMINPGYADVLRLCEQDLAPEGYIAIVDFHDSALGWFRRWMGLNHVRMDGQVLAELQAMGLAMATCEVHKAYGGVWRWVLCLVNRGALVQSPKR